jgi:hypothetical protein
MPPDDSTELKPTKEELRKIGCELLGALASVREKYPTLELVVSYALPRENDATKLATSVAWKNMDPKNAIILLAHGAQEIKSQMIDPFYR